MTLEPEDYIEPHCPLGEKCSCAGVHAHGNSTCSDPLPLEKIIEESDRFFNAGEAEKVGEHLRFWLNEARKRTDRRGELSILSELMGHYRMNNDPERGLESVDSGLALLKELDLSGTLSAGTILLNAATALQSFGHVDRALSLYAESARIYERHLDPGDWRFAGLFNNMAAAYCEKKEFKLAEKCYLRALEVLQTCRNIMDAAVTCLNLAQLYRSWNNDTLLIDGMIDCAMACFDDPAAPRDGYYAHTCCKCASGFGALGRSELEKELKSRAEEYYARH